MLERIRSTLLRPRAATLNDPLLSHCAKRLLRHTHKRDRRNLTIEVGTGIILGYVYSQTVKLILHYDLETHEIKDAQHVSFHETMFDVEDKAPDAALLASLHAGEKSAVDVSELEVLFSTFQNTHALY